MGDKGEGLTQYRLKCENCGEEIDSFVTAEELNEGTEACTNCGDASSFTHVDVES